MKIAILGAGNIGGTLGKKWSAAGHEIMFGVRDVTSSKTQAALEAAGAGVCAASVAQATSFAQVILFSLPSGAMAETAQVNANNLVGKILIDASNNFTGPVINNLEALQRAAPSATLYRAFNSLGWEIFANPVVNNIQADMFYTGPDGAARQQIQTLIAQVGVRPIWVGDNDRAALVDNLGALWVHLVFRQGMPRGIALKLLQPG